MTVQVAENLNNTPFILSGESFSKDSEILKQDAGRSAVFAPFTVLGKRKNTVATTGTLTAGGAADGTCTAIAKLADAKGLITGDYILTCLTAVAHGGVWKLEDPYGAIIETGFAMTASTGAATIFNIGGITFTLTDGANDFEVADLFTIVVTVDGDLIPLDGADLNGGAEVYGIYLGSTITAAKMVAGDVAALPVLVGGACTVASGKVVLENSLALTSILPSGLTVEQELRSLGIFTESTVDIDSYENA